MFPARNLRSRERRLASVVRPAGLAWSTLLQTHGSCLFGNSEALQCFRQQAKDTPQKFLTGAVVDVRTCRTTWLSGSSRQETVHLSAHHPAPLRSCGVVEIRAVLFLNFLVLCKFSILVLTHGHRIGLNHFNPEQYGYYNTSDGQQQKRAGMCLWEHCGRLSTPHLWQRTRGLR